MHTFTYNEDIAIHYNGDLSGDVIIIKSENKIIKEFTLPAQVFLDFVADYVRRYKIGELEDKTTEEILGI